MANRRYEQRYNQGNIRGDEADDHSRHRNSAYDRTERDSNEHIYNRYNRDELRYGRGRDSYPGLGGENNPGYGRSYGSYGERYDRDSRYSDVPFSGGSRYGNDEYAARSEYSRDYNRDYGRDYGRGPSNNNDWDRGTVDSRYDNRLDRPRADRHPDSERGYYEGRSARGNSRDDRGWWDKATDEVSSWMGDEEAARRREMDARGEGRYRGHGPKNYTRSDDRIREDVNDRLTDYHYLDASHIEVAVEKGEVTLSGFVQSRYAKRMAEDLAEDVTGVKNVENRLRVSEKESNWGYGNSDYTTSLSSKENSESTETDQPRSFTKNA